MTDNQPKKPMRVSVTFSADAVAWLERESIRRAITISEMVRRVIDETRGDYILQREASGGSGSRARHDRGGG